MDNDLEGRVAAGDQALVNQAATHLGPTGFDPSRRPSLSQRLDEFTDALFALPWVAERVADGQQFNAYQIAGRDDDDDLEDWADDEEYALCIGPITDARHICHIDSRDRAALLEAALKVATEAFREQAASAIEAGTAETLSGSVHESAGLQGDAQTSQPNIKD